MIQGGPPTPPRIAIARMTAEKIDLYTLETPLGENVPMGVAPLPIEKIIILGGQCRLVSYIPVKKPVGRKITDVGRVPSRVAGGNGEGEGPRHQELGTGY